MNSMELTAVVRSMLLPRGCKPEHVAELCRAEQLLREAAAQKGARRRETLSTVRQIVEVAS